MEASRPTSTSGKTTMKEWCRSLQPIQLYVVIALTVAFLTTEMVVSHTTHALTLLVDAYHMMCNIVSLMGFVVNVKCSAATRAPCQPEEQSLDAEEDASCTLTVDGDSACREAPCSSERRLKNTFGWARVDVVMMLSGGVVLASLCFSVVVEALQTLVHIGHQHQMHQPILIMCLGAIGLLLNGFCYLLIGGYTFHQSSFLQATSSGDVLDKTAGEKASTVMPAPVRASLPGRPMHRQKCREVARDITGSMLVVVCSLIVYFTDECVAKYVDPSLAILSSVVLVVLSYPYMKESGLILLQTMPDSINIDSLRTELLKAFPGVLNVHDLHVWRLTASKVYTTAHVIFLSATDYSKISKEMTEFFREHGITHVTIQPEFYKLKISSVLADQDQCLVRCKSEWCHAQHCCANIVAGPHSVVVTHAHGHSHAHSHAHSHEQGFKTNKSEQKNEGCNKKSENATKGLNISLGSPLRINESSVGDTGSVTGAAHVTSGDSQVHSVPKETFEIDEGRKCSHT